MGIIHDITRHLALLSQFALQFTLTNEKSNANTVVRGQALACKQVLHCKHR